MAKIFRLAASMAVSAIMGPVCFGQRYAQTNLVSSTAGVARVNDPQLVNPRGMSRSTSSGWWVSVEKAGFTVIYNGEGAKQSLVVAIPPADVSRRSTLRGAPTGVVFNHSQTDFLLAAHKPAMFLFSTTDGTIAGWNPEIATVPGAALPSTRAVTVVKTGDGSNYTGLTSAFIDGKPYLYAANFTKGRVDAYDTAFRPVGRTRKDRKDVCSDQGPCFPDHAFEDEGLPAPYTPFNVQAIGDDVVVTYAVYQPAVSPLALAGPGLGFVDIFNSTGHLLLRLEHGYWLNAPWGVTLAPADFGRFSHNLLIGQFAGGGNGFIAAYDLTTGKLNGLLQDANGDPLVIAGLCALSPGNGSPNNSDSKSEASAEVYFTAGQDNGSAGLFGYLAPISVETQAGGMRWQASTRNIR
jgi:uncharacterized protein (TIGR03118 family)